MKIQVEAGERRQPLPCKDAEVQTEQQAQCSSMEQKQELPSAAFPPVPLHNQLEATSLLGMRISYSWLWHTTGIKEKFCFNYAMLLTYRTPMNVTKTYRTYLPVLTGIIEPVICNF